MDDNGHLAGDGYGDFMSEIDRTVTVPGNQRLVWDYLSDFTNTEEWDPPTESTERVSGDGGVGTLYRRVHPRGSGQARHPSAACRAQGAGGCGVGFDGEVPA